MGNKIFEKRARWDRSTAFHRAIMKSGHDPALAACPRVIIRWPG